MKRMNLVFITRILSGFNVSKSFLMLATFFLFGLGINSVSAQYISEKDALTVLTEENVSIVKNRDNVYKSKDLQLIEKTQLKQRVLRAMIQKLKAGSTVKETVDYFFTTESGNNSGSLKRGSFSRKGNVSLDPAVKQEVLDLLRS